MQRAVQPTSGAIRAANRNRVVAELRLRGAVTRAELGQRTGLSRATVSAIVGDLLAAGLVSERRAAGSSTGSSTGRPPTALALNRQAGLAIAVDVGVRHVAVAVGDLSRSIIAERWTDLSPGHRPETGIETVLASIAETLRESGADEDQVVGAAISIAAPIARDSGRLPVPGVLPGWNGAELARIVGETWHIPVAIENDANLGALGETVSRGPVNESVVLYVKLASRIGLGIALGSRIFRGQDGYAGELGHVSVDPQGERCWCGRRGCLELYAGGDGILRRLGERAPATLGELVARAHAGDAQVLGLMEPAAELLARALTHIALVMNPSAILVGGELAALGHLVLDPICRALESVPFGVPAEVAVSSLGERASLLGALALVLSESDHFVDRSCSLVRHRAGELAPETSPWGRGTHLVTG